jgi:hypothetical protein
VGRGVGPVVIQTMEGKEVRLNSMNVVVFALSPYQAHKCQRVIAMKYKANVCLVLK